MSKTTSTLTTRILLFLTVPALLLLASAPAAATPDERSWAPTLAVLDGGNVEAVLFGATPVTEQSIEGPSAQAESTAICCDGSTVTCTGDHTEATDAGCDTGQQGFCYSSETGHKSCPDCSTSVCQACAGPSCPEMHGAPCTGSETLQCVSVDGSCGSCFCFRGSFKCF